MIANKTNQFPRASLISRAGLEVVVKSVSLTSIITTWDSYFKDFKALYIVEKGADINLINKKLFGKLPED